MSYFIEKTFVASTAHITREDNDILCNLSLNYEGGLLITIDEDFYMRDLKETELSETFKNLYFLAKSMGCDKLRLDRDQVVYKNLPTFNW